LLIFTCREKESPMSDCVMYNEDFPDRSGCFSDRTSGKNGFVQLRGHHLRFCWILLSDCHTLSIQLLSRIWWKKNVMIEYISVPHQSKSIWRKQVYTSCPVLQNQ
jgi:hypothetical protein